MSSSASESAASAIWGGVDYRAEDGGHTQVDERTFFGFTHADFPGEKRVACRNPELAARRKHKREALLKATTEALEKIQGMVTRGTLKDAVHHYKALSQVERVFRSIKTMDLEARPIHHYQEQRLRSHLFLCMLAYIRQVAPDGSMATAAVCR